MPQFRLHVVIDAFEAHIGQAARHSTQAVFWRLLRLAAESHVLLDPAAASALPK